MTNARTTALAAISVRRRRMSSEANMCSVMVANTCSVVKDRCSPSRGRGLRSRLGWRDALPERRRMTLRLAHRSLPLDGPPCMMGIVNVTPDSFYDRGATAAPDAAVARGLELVRAGAGIVDVGGMTAQPGRVLSEDEEIDRVAGVVAALRARLDVPISIDTYRARVADAALRAGADIVNDHTGLTDPDMAATIAGHRAGLVVTHLSIAPKQVQEGRHAVPVDDIAEFLVTRADAARAAGVDADAILVDPGLGFGKDTATDLRTLAELPRLSLLGYPLLLAPSH